MSRTPLPYYATDISVLAKTIRRSMDAMDRSPSHVEMLNLLAKAGGFRNFQHFRASHDTPAKQPSPQRDTPQVNTKHVSQAARHYTMDERLIRWPKKFCLRMLCLWVLWSRIPARTRFSEPEINERIRDHHLFDDHALLRRELVDRGFILRTDDGRRYTRIERQPSPEAIELFLRLRTRRETDA